MASVVIAHATDDALPARALAQKIAAMGLTPVIDLAPGETLRRAMDEAHVVIALWSPRSIGRADLIDDLAQAEPLIHACMQNATPPAPFVGAPAIDLTGWRGEDSFPAWRELAGAIGRRTGLGAAREPEPPAQSEFFQPGPNPPPHPASPRPTPPRSEARAPEPPRAEPPRAAPPAYEPSAYEPRDTAPAYQDTPAEPPAYRDPPRPAYLDEEPKQGPNLAVIGIVTFLLVAVVGGGGYYFFNNMQGQGSAAAAWENVDPNDPDEIRAFLEGEPGALRAEAEAALAQLEEANFDAAREADTIEAFEQFLADFPDSNHALEARGRIAELRVAPSLIPEGEEEIDPLTGLPYPTDDPPTDPDLVPPGSVEPIDPPPAGAPAGIPLNPGAAPSDSSGPAPLTPPTPDEQPTN